MARPSTQPKEGHHSMIGYSNAIGTSLNQRPEDLRRAAAHQAAARAARSEARRVARKDAEAAQQRRDQSAVFSWETHRLLRNLPSRLVGRAR